MSRSNPRQNSPRALQINDKTSLGRAGLILAAMIAVSRLTGFGRLMVTTYFFGRRPETAAYLAAFNIPDTLAILISGGLLATGFVPVFTRLLTNGDSAGAQRTFRALLTLMLVGFGGVSLVLLALTWTPFGTLLAPDKVAPEFVGLYLHILRILLLAQFLFVVGGVFAGTFNALRLFWFQALQPVFYNCGVIIFGIWGARRGLATHSGIEWQAWGALVGAFCGTVLMFVPAALKNGLQLRPLWDLRDEGVRRVAASFGPIVLGLASGQIIALNLPRAFAKFLPVSAFASLDSANRLMQVPLDLLASSAAVALLPTLSRLWVEEKPAEMRAAFNAALAKNVRLMLFATAMLIALAPFLVHLLLERGQFSARDGAETSFVLQCYALCLPALGAQQLLARAFYASERGRDVVGIGAFSMALFLIFGALSLPLQLPGGAGLALAAALATSVLSGLLALKLRAQWGEIGGVQLKKAALFGFVTAIIAAICARIVAGVGAHFLAPFDLETTPQLLKLGARTLTFGGGAAFGTAAWVALSKMPGLSNWRNRK
ncbi:lipid II flippase MurJ [Abditibacterium utsteinense]|nr:lipid II flippase MurJ [Abditibacterium utsteinense]